jgi:hypothetical protein
MPDIGRGRHFFNKLWLTVGSVLRPGKIVSVDATQ